MKKLTIFSTIIFCCCFQFLTNPRPSRAQMNQLAKDHTFPPRLRHEAEVFNETEPGAPEENRYGAIARDYLQNPDKYSEQNSAWNIADETWNLKLSESNITGDTQFGISVACAGDVNNDGYDDVLVGAYGYDICAGRAFLYYGGPSMDTIANVVMAGESEEDYFGWTVAGVGDVNKDGYDDVLIGAHWYEYYIGRVYLYYGGKVMDSVADLILTGEPSQDWFGYVVAGAGDVNGDGYADIMVSAYRYNYDIGRVYLYFGGPNMSTDADVVLYGGPSQDWFGCSVAGVGDVNNDGYDDILIGASEYNNDTGRAFLYFGGAVIDTTKVMIFTGQTIEEGFGCAVSGGGDINNDGYKDILVSAQGYNNGIGRVYLYYGSQSMNNVAKIVLTGESAYRFGSAVAGAGDVNHDGYDDVLIGAYGYSNWTGQTYLYFGGPAMDNAADVVLTGEATNNYFGWSVAGAGDINADNFNDFIIGAPRNGKNWDGAAYLYFGSQTLDIAEPGTNPTQLPDRLQLQNNYPNPFNPGTTISFDLPERANVQIVIYDLTGRTVKTLLHEWRNAGFHQINWDGRDDSGLPVSSGVYLCKFETDGGYTETKRMALVR